ncbi:MAG TPA: peptidase S58 family protein, partial [Acidimicrobiia bacterium]|nr:peptidase S58 family protein [Acidimicrobiia bacterium]
MIWEIPGIRVGHWTGDGTGVTVVLAPSGCVGSGEVRGGAPATREAAVLTWGSLVDRVDAVVLCGGSAFGLAAADGVMRYLAERGQGFPTSGGAVPIVVAAGVFDESARTGAGLGAPGPAEGRAAAEAAEGGDVPALGRVGAGTGATVGKWRGADFRVPGGVGGASARCEAATVAALAVVNALGDVTGSDGSVLAGSTAPSGAGAFPELAADTNPFEQTTLVVV